MDVQELKSTEIWNYLNSLDASYAERAVIFLQWISPLLATIPEYFPYYTRHDAHHSYEVLKRIGQIINPECFLSGTPASLTAPETFLLICSAYGHDLGMTVFPGEENDLLAKLGLTEFPNWKTAKVLQDYLRSNHSNRGTSYILENCEINGIPTNLIGPLSDIMRSHNLSPHELEIQLGKRVAAGEKEIELKQLACILCIGDALEFSDTRVIDGVFKKLRVDKTEDGVISFRENMKHICIGDSVAIGVDGRIIFSGTFTDPTVLALAHHTVDLIEDWVQQYCDIDYRCTVKRLRLRSDGISRNLDIPGIDFERLGIRLKKENVINLIASDSTWSNDPGIPIRELLQNAVEACRYRRHNTLPNRKYSPEISIIIDRANHQLFIIDNGCGMSRNIILTNFLTVGNSRSFNSTYKSHDYDSLSRFGIGFWSVFTIATSATIETAPFERLSLESEIHSSVDGLKFNVTLEESEDFTVFYPIKKSAGTSITLKLKESIQLDRLLGSLEKIMVCSEIPISVSIPKTQEGFAIPQKPQLLNETKLFGPKLKHARSQRVQIYNWECTDELVELSMNLAYRVQNDKATFLLPDNKNSMIRVVNSFGSNIIMGVCGFPVPIPIEFCFGLDRVGRVSANVKSPKGFKYRLDRRTLLPSEELQNAGFNISNKIHEGYRNFLKSNNCYNSQDIYKLNRQSRLHGGEVYDSYTKNKLALAFELFPDLISFKLYVVHKDIDYQHAIIRYVNLNEIRQLTGQIWCCQNYESHTEELYIDSQDLVGPIYEFLRHRRLTGTHFVAEPCIESSMLFDNCQNSQISIVQMGVKPKGEIKLLLMNLSCENIDIINKPQIIGEVSGQWAGTIYQCKINKQPGDYAFVFLGRNRFVVERNSKLAKKIQELYMAGRIFTIANLLNKLQDAKNGYFDEQLHSELGELLYN